ncbi:WD40-repeat-containing domain protein [Obelidium mucronatum]|nr:WD40-repeat-containing domain protein [Obelidium mucronatum]
MESDSDPDWIDVDEHQGTQRGDDETESSRESESDEEEYWDAEADDDDGDDDVGGEQAAALEPNSRSTFPKAALFNHFRSRDSAIVFSPFAKQLLLSKFLPSAKLLSLPHHLLWKEYTAKPYCAQFSDDGSLFYSATQDFQLHLYNAHNNFSKIATINACPGRWTITDCDMSKDSRSLLYSSIHRTIFFVNLAPLVNNEYVTEDDDYSSHIPLSMGENCGIWSIRLSDDGKEVVAGASEGLIFVYDVEYKRVLHRVDGHQDDVNAVTFADQSSNLLLSGSDDGLLKVWDRRSSLQSNTPAGILPGHTEGITFITTKGRDGRTAVSNAKDQTMKLWDLRKLVSASGEKARALSRVDYSTGFDYRWQPYPKNHARTNPHDVSVGTFKGHSVLRTLIRCHYSPASTGHRYLYTGSADGSVYIYDPVLNPSGGEPIRVLNSSPLRSNEGAMTAEEEEAVLERFAPDDREMTAAERSYLLRLLRQRQRQISGREVCVRDVAWNPDGPQIIASVWRNEEGGLESFEYQ